MEIAAPVTFEHRFSRLTPLRTVLFGWFICTVVVLGMIAEAEPSRAVLVVVVVLSIAVLFLTLRNRITVVVRADARGIAIIRESALNYFTLAEFYPAAEIKCVHYRSDIRVNTASSYDQRYIQYELALELTDGRSVRIYSRNDEYLSRNLCAKLAEVLGVAYVEALPDMPRDVPALSSRGKKNTPA